MYKYSLENAAIYNQLGIIGTTYEVSFNEAKTLLGDLRGKTVLDFGTGTGRSARLLQTLGASQVIGVDHDHNMIQQARVNAATGITFEEITKGHIPLANQSVDAVLSAHVFVEMKTTQQMTASAQEIARVLKPEGRFILISTSPFAIGHEFVSYRYKPQENMKSGDPITCVVKGATPFEIDDTYWTEDDYRRVVETAGFRDISISYPLATGEGWLEETIVAPDIVFMGRIPHVQ